MNPVRVVEVGPRDGLQNEPVLLSVEQRVAFVNELLAAGCAEIEVGAFVNPKLVPAMAGSGEVLRELGVRADARLIVLVPNERGLNAALDAGAKSIAVFAAASETFSQKNIGRSISESLDEYRRVVARAKQGDLWVRGYVSTVTHCPYEGKISPGAVVSVAQALREMGCDEIALGETLGRATVDDLAALLDAVTLAIPPEMLAGHFHDTSGRALSLVERALEYGIRAFDGSTGGLGGCPFAPGAAGNLATESLVARLHALGYTTGIDAEALALVGARLRKTLAGVPYPSAEP